MDLKLGADGDLAVENGDLVLVEGVEETAQRLACKFQLFYGEWFLEPEAGVKYRTLVWPRTVAHNIKVNLFRQILQDDPGVAQVLQMSLTPLGDRRWEPLFVIRTPEGQILKSGDFHPFVVG
jgi:hypothetical protein